MEPESKKRKLVVDTVEFDVGGKIFNVSCALMRYGSIYLPPTIPETMFQRELDYYGIAAGDGTVKSVSFLEYVQANYAKFVHHKLAKEMLDLAAKCNTKLLQAVGTGKESVGFNFRSEERELYDSYRQQNGPELLKKYLDKFFGLTAAVSCNDSYLRVSVKK